MSTPPPPPPPEGFASWLDFAVETFDTRGPWVEGLFSDDAAPDRDAMRETARAELAKLRQQAVDARTAFACANFAPKGIYRFKTHEDANRQEEAWLAEGMAKLALDRRAAANNATQSDQPIAQCKPAMPSKKANRSPPAIQLARRTRRKTFTLAELLAQCDASPQTEEFKQEMREWCAGRERVWEPQPELHVCLRAKLALRARHPRPRLRRRARNLVLLR